jgi:type I restriction enzyme, S subunit
MYPIAITDKSLDSGYLLFFMLSDPFVRLMVDESMRVAMPKVNREKLAACPLLIPRLDEQKAIAAFLDRETARIDALVTKKERLIELLQEKRTALVTSAVTKGLDPNVTMKNSGVKWLGQIPAHWNVVRSKRLFRLRNIRALAGETQLTATQQYGVIPQSEFMALQGRRVVQVVFGADILKHVEANDFVISMRSFQGGIEWSPSAGAISSAYVVLSPSQEVWHPYFVHLFKSTRYIQALQATSDLVRDGQALRFENFTQVDLPSLPMSEQSGIAAFLDSETARIDKLVTKVGEAIDRLKELRVALISDVVTGKIGVRGALAEAAANEGGAA